MADEHDRHTALAAQLAQQFEHFATSLSVEAPSRLVGEQQARSGGEGTRDHHALALAHRESLRAVVQALAQPEPHEQWLDLAPRLAPAHRAQQLENRVVDRADAGQQVEALTDEAELGEPEARGLAL